MALAIQPKPAQASPQQLFSEEAEQATLGGLISRPDLFAIVAGYLKQTDFFLLRHGYIWQALKDLTESKTPLDYLTIMNRLRERKWLDLIGGPSYLTQLITSAPTSVNTEVYAKMVERLSYRRQLVTTSEQFRLLAHNEELPLEEIVATAETHFNNVRNRVGGEVPSLKEVNHSLLSAIEFAKDNPGVVTGIASGLTDLDVITNGYEAGQMIVIAGRPGMGKSAIALDSAYHAATNGKKVLYLSLEMGADELIGRLYSQLSGVPFNKQKSGRITPIEYKSILEASSKVDAVADETLFIDDVASIGPAGLRAKVRVMAANGGIDMVIVDYLQLMNSDGLFQNDKTNSVGYISTTLKQLSREINIPVIAVAQLNRSLENRADKRPVLSDLRDSGQIEQDADKVIFIYRDEVYNDATEFPNQMDLIVAKHRNGATGTATAYWDRVAMKPRNGVKRKVELGNTRIGE